MRTGLVPTDNGDAAQLVVGVGVGGHGVGELFDDDLIGLGVNVAPAGARRDMEAVVAAIAQCGALLVGEAAPLLALQFRDGLISLALPLAA